MLGACGSWLVLHTPALQLLRSTCSVSPHEHLAPAVWCTSTLCTMQLRPAAAHTSAWHPCQRAAPAWINFSWGRTRCRYIFQHYNCNFCYTPSVAPVVTARALLEPPLTPSSTSPLCARPSLSAIRIRLSCTAVHVHCGTPCAPQCRTHACTELCHRCAQRTATLMHTLLPPCNCTFVLAHLHMPAAALCPACTLAAVRSMHAPCHMPSPAHHQQSL